MVENSSKGVTLLSLVVTIVVLLILAGVTIGIVLSNNGVVDKTLDTKKQAEASGEEEYIRILALSGKITGERTGTALRKE